MSELVCHVLLLSDLRTGVPCIAVDFGRNGVPYIAVDVGRNGVPCIVVRAFMAL
jgi:hypothetical protein